MSMRLAITCEILEYSCSHNIGDAQCGEKRIHVATVKLQWYNVIFEMQCFLDNFQVY